MRNVTALFGMLALMFGAAAHAEVNPIYASWAQYGVGTSVTTRSISQMTGTKSDTEMTSTLLEKRPEQVVIEMVVRGAVSGRTTRATRLQIKAEAPQHGRLGKEAQQESEERITVGGKRYNAKVIEIRRNEGTQTIWSKTWTGPEFPGMTIKSIYKMDGPKKIETTVETTGVTIK